MASEVELERMVVRLIGEAEEYLAMLKEAEEGTEATAEKIEDTAAEIEEFAGSMQKAGAAMSVAFTLPLTILSGVATAAHGIQEQAEITLQGILDANERVEGTFESYAQFSSALQDITKTGDEATLEMFRTAESLGVTGEAAKTAVKEAMALGAALGMSGKSAARYTVMLAQGDTMMLNRYIPTLRKFEDESERVAEAHRVLARMFSVAEAEAQSFTGSLTQLSNSTGDLMEQFGKIIAGFLRPFIKIAKEVVAMFQAIPEAGKAVIVVVGGLLAVIGPTLIALGTFVKLLILSEAGLKAFSIVALLVKARITAIFVATKLATVAQIAFKALMGPKGWAAIALGITAATGAILIYKDRMKAVTKEAEETGRVADKAGKRAEEAMNSAKVATEGYTGAVKDLSKAIKELPIERQQFLALSIQAEEAEVKLDELKRTFTFEQELVRQQVPGAGVVDIGGVGVSLDIAEGFIEDQEAALVRLEERVGAARKAMERAAEPEIDLSQPEEILAELFRERGELSLELRGADEVERRMDEIDRQVGHLGAEFFEAFGGRGNFFRDAETEVRALIESVDKLATKERMEALEEQYATPFEKAKKKVEDLVQLLRTHGEERFGETFNRAAKAAVEEFKSAIEGVEQERITPEAVQTISRGSVEEMLLRQESRMAFIVQEPTTAQADSTNLADTAKNTADMKIILSIIAGRAGLVLEPADVGGGG